MVYQRGRKSRGQIIQRYSKFRNLVFQHTEKEFPGIQASEIKLAYAIEGDRWTDKWKSIDKAKTPTWKWVDMFQMYNSKSGDKRFDIAISKAGKLCALCYGVPTKKKLALKIHLLSSDPMDHPLKGRIFEVILFASNAYAGLIGADQIWLVDPLSEGVTKLYASYGFKLDYSKADQCNYMYRKQI